MCPTPLEGLATNGIVHFDPNAYIRYGASPYVAEQDAYLPFDQPLYATPYPGMVYPPPVMYHEQPHRDVYVRHEKSSSWGAGILGVVVGALATVLGYELFKGKEHPITGEQVKDKAKGVWEGTKDLAKGAKDRVGSWFKKGESEVDKVINDAAKGSAKTQNGFFKTRFRKTKIGLGIAAGLGVLYLAYKLITGKSHNASSSSSGH